MQINQASPNLAKLTSALAAARARNNMGATSPSQPKNVKPQAEFLASLKKVASEFPRPKVSTTGPKQVRPATFQKIERPETEKPKRNLGNRIDLMA